MAQFVVEVARAQAGVHVEATHPAALNCGCPERSSTELTNGLIVFAALLPPAEALGAWLELLWRFGSTNHHV